MSKKFKTAEFGSISHGTMRTQDLIPTFCAELRALGHRSAELTRIESRYHRATNGRFGEDDSYLDGESAGFDLEFLFDCLDEHSPAYGYFGANMGDGSDYGFWLWEDFSEDFDGLKVEDLADVPDDYMGEILVINDHGNMTLYVKSSRKLREIWALV